MVAASTKRKPPTPKKVKAAQPEAWAIDTEGTGLDIRHGCRPFFLSACSEAGKLVYWEWDVNPLTRTPVIHPKEKKEVRDFLTGKELVFHNPKYDLLALQFSDLWPEKEFPEWELIQSTDIAAHLIDSAGSHKLKDLALQYLDISDEDEDELKQAVAEARKIAKRKYPDWQIAEKGHKHFPSVKRAPKSGWGVMDYWLPRAIAKAEKLPKNHLFWKVNSVYGLTDVERTIGLWQLFKHALKELGLIDLYHLRKRMIEVTYQLEANGVTINKKRIDSAIESYTKDSKESEKIALEIAEHRIDNLGSPKQLQAWLYHVKQIKPTKRTKTGYATDEKTLLGIKSGLKPSNPVFQFIKHLIRSRKLKKGVDYLESYKVAAFPMKGCPGWLRMHSNNNITGTGTTRLSSSDPNTQNVGKKSICNLRNVFGPSPGRIWYALDYQNIELRIPAYTCMEPELVKLFNEGGSYHLLVGSVLYPDLFKKLGPEKFAKTPEYGYVKNGNFASQYGAQEFTGDAAYGVKGAWAKLRNRFRKITKLSNSCLDHAREHGHVETILGYPLQCPRDEYGRIIPTTPFNYWTQGTAGLAIQIAMERVHGYLKTLGPEYKMILTIHDELVFDFPKGKKNIIYIRHIKHLMEQSGKDLGLPTPVDVEEITSTWANPVGIAA